MRDKRGRFKKVDKEGITIHLGCPSLKKLFLYVIILIIFLPWFAICCKWQILKKILDFTEKLFKFNESENSSEGKKNGLFY